MYASWPTNACLIKAACSLLLVLGDAANIARLKKTGLDYQLDDILIHMLMITLGEFLRLMVLDLRHTPLRWICFSFRI